MFKCCITENFNFKVIHFLVVISAQLHKLKAGDALSCQFGASSLSMSTLSDASLSSVSAFPVQETQMFNKRTMQSAQQAVKLKKFWLSANGDWGQRRPPEQLLPPKSFNNNGNNNRNNSLLFKNNGLMSFAPLTFFLEESQRNIHKEQD